MKASIICTIVGILTLTLLASRERSYPTAPDLAGPWVGFADNDQFVRMLLANNGTGSFILVDSAEAIYYPISSWNVTSNHMSITLKYPDANNDKILLTVEDFSYSSISILAQIENITWKSRIVLHREDDWRKRLNKAKRSASRHR